MDVQSWTYVRYPFHHWVDGYHHIVHHSRHLICLLGALYVYMLAKSKVLVTLLKLVCVLNLQLINQSTSVQYEPYMIISCCTD